MRTSFCHFILESTSGINQDSCAAEMRLGCLRNDFKAVGESSDACACAHGFAEVEKARDEVFHHLATNDINEAISCSLH